MQKYKARMQAVVSCLLLIGVLLSGCSELQAAPRREVDEAEYGKEDTTFDATVKAADGFYPVTTVGNYQLLINGQTADIAVKNLQTGVTWSSNPENAAAETTDGFTASQFSVSYIDSQDKLNERNSYTDSVKIGQYSFYPLSNGVRVNYLVNEKKKQYLVPPVIGKERFEAILAKLPEEDQLMMNSFYLIKTLDGVSPEVEAWQKIVFPALRYGDIYVLSSGYSHTEGVTASDLMLQMIEPYFIKAGYTEEDLKFDTEQNSLEPVDDTEYSIELSIEYTLDENGLVARIPQKSIIYDEATMKLTEIDFLPFMGATDSEDEGYLLVPDGSGAIINLNNGKKTISAYEKRVYGADNSLQVEEQETDDGSQIYLPVFGIRSNQAGMLAVIEKGDAVATIHADVSGKLNSYNYAYSSYTLIESGIETNAILNQSGGSLYQKQPLKSDIQLRYLFTEENQGTYAAMASRYRQYLMDTGNLQKQVKEGSKLSFALNTIGAVTYKTTMLGVPVEAEKALTTFEQAESILEQLQEASISNIVFSYSGWMNNGLYGNAPYKIKPVGVLGGKNDFNDLISYTREKGISFFPEVNLSYVSDTGNGYSKNGDSARDLSGNVAKNHTYNLALQRWNEDQYEFIISPLTYGRLAESFLKAYQNYEVGGVSLPLLSKELNGDYHKTNSCDRQEAVAKAQEAFSAVSDAGYQVLVDGANAYALNDATYVTGIPSNSGNHYLFDETVPFYQIVLHGVMPFSGTPLNLSGDFEREVLKCIEYGAAPSFQWIYADNIELKETDYNIYNVHYALWMEDAIDAYQSINKALSGCQDATIVAHEKLGKDLYKTTYDNGYRIYVNYSDQPVETEGHPVAARNYTVVTEVE